MKRSTVGSMVLAGITVLERGLWVTNRWNIGLVVLLVFVGPRLTDGATYSVTDLGTLGGSGVRPCGINSSGQIVGYSSTADGAKHAFLYDAGTMSDLGTLPECSYSYARSINDSGHVVGYSGVSGSSNHGFLLNGVTMMDLGLLPDYTSCVATAINPDGWVTGYIHGGAAERAHGFLWRDGTMTDIGKPSGYYGGAIPECINAGGQVAGYAITSAGDDHASVYSGETWEDLGTLGGEKSRATCINDLGQVVGWPWTASGPGHAFLYEDGTMKDLGVPVGWRSSVGNWINATGQVVGQCGQSGGLYHAFLYGDGRWADLNDMIVPTANWTLQEALAVNDSGLIVGLGTRDGTSRAFLLTPVPEPSTLALVGVGILSLIGCARRRHAKVTVLAAAFAAIATTATADIIMFTQTGTGSGTIGTTPIVDAHFTSDRSRPGEQ